VTADSSLLDTLKLVTDIVAGWTTIGGIVTGGWWSYRKFFRRREQFPHADLAHELTDWLLPNGARWLHATLVVKNKGEGLLQVLSATTRVQLVIPAPQGLLDATDKTCDVLPPGAIEYPWPMLQETTIDLSGGPTEIEPKETDRLEFDLFLPRVARVIEVYSYVVRRQLKWDKRRLKLREGLAV
jgi:hypothetical protein